MPSHRRVRPRLYVLIGTFCVLPGILVFALLPWLRQQPVDLLFLVTGIAGTLTILASLALGIVHDRSMDEWEKSNSRFASFWGEAVGTSLVGLLLSVPAGREWIFSVVTKFADVSRPDQLVILAFVSGFMAVVIARAVCMAVLSIGWTLWKSRSPREAA